MRNVPRLVIAGTGSGVGKTTVMVGLCRALRARGLKVAVFKAGPDYLDPTYHTRAAGLPSQTLDGWMMGRRAVLHVFASAATQADIALIEGVMGLFDGVAPNGGDGSTAQIAKWLRAPVVIVVDASGMARTLAAIVHGMTTFDPELPVSGVVCNLVGSRGHLELLRQAVAAPTVFGGLPTDRSLAFPERHLGLYAADEESIPDTLLEELGKRVEEWCDVDSLLALARSAPTLESHADAFQAAFPNDRDVSHCRIGIARDAAFHFYYEDNLRRLRDLGAELISFSPLADGRLPDVDGLYLGGGYPEVHAAALAGNLGMRQEIAAFAAAGKPIYAECGGLMYLTRGMRTLDGRVYDMVGLIPAEAILHDSLQALGYVEVETVAPTILGAAGLRFRGHQFRYSQLHLETEEIGRAYRLKRFPADACQFEGYSPLGNVLASYVHAHWASNPDIAAGFFAACCNPPGSTRDWPQESEIPWPRLLRIK